MSRRFLLVLATLTLAAASLGSASSSAAAVITPTRFDDPTPDGCEMDDCSLREAIIQANASAGPDEIVLAAGTYRLTITGSPEDLAASGDLDITRETLSITGAGKTSTVIDAGEDEVLNERVLHIGQFETGDPPNVSVSQLTITGGWANTSPELNGGGIYLEDGTLAVTDAGLIDNYGGQTGSGGGLGAEAATSATVTRVEIAENSTTTAGSAAGIALVQADVTIVDSVLHDNHAMFDGGAISAVSSTLTIRDTTISGNTSTDHGGGVALAGGTSTLDNVTITGNVADTNETADDDGGGLYVFSGAVTLRNSIVAGNEDRSPSGNQHEDCSGTVVSEGHNLIGNNEGCSFTPGPGDQVGSASSPIDPKLGPLADNGGPTPTHALVPSSPAIEGGDTVFPRSGGAGCDAADQRGASRIGTCDIGAYELVLCLGVPVNRVGGAAADVLTGSEGADSFLAQGGSDTVNGLGGDDAVCLGEGNDTADGGAGRDGMSGDAGNDTTRGGSGNDFQTGGSGNDRLSGGGGRDRLKGQAGKDKLKGQGGKDRMAGGGGRDTCTGGGGKDKAACEQEKKVP